MERHVSSPREASGGAAATVSPASAALQASPGSAALQADADAVRSRVRGRMPTLDGIRGIAVLLVVYHNAGSAQVRADSRIMKAVFYTHAWGWVGVQLFFALSGFLITGILLEARGTNHLEAIRWFWGRRALRIFPLYFAALLPLSLVTISRAGLVADFGSPTDLWWYWTYLSNWGQPRGHMIGVLAHFWSLAVEEQFYATWPLLVLFCRPRIVLRVSIGLAAIALVLRIWLCSRGLSEVTYENTFTRMDALALGAAAAVVARDPSALRRVAPLLGWTIVASLGALLAMPPFTRGFNSDHPLVQTLGYVFLSVLSAALVLWSVVNEGVPRARFLQARWLRSLGQYSYGIYVLHFPFAVLLAHRLGPVINGPAPGRAFSAWALHEGLVCTFAVGAALLTWRFVEQPALAWRDRLGLRPSSPDERAAAAPRKFDPAR
jgi:peptidoglycan/LPS O-acetylase OafA/YrhL